MTANQKPTSPKHVSRSILKICEDRERTLRFEHIFERKEIQLTIRRRSERDVLLILSTSEFKELSRDLTTETI